MQTKQQKKKTFDASHYRLGIAVAEFNPTVTAALLRSALRTLAEYNINRNKTTIVRVPGSVELPFALQTLALTGRYDALVALGCVIRGETPHFEYVCKTVQEGILRVSLDEGVPIGFGVLTLQDAAQARARVNLGAQAASAALELARLKRRSF